MFWRNCLGVFLKIASSVLSSQINGHVGRFVKNYPNFVNKYLNRSNGGIPCFSEERLLERAAKVVISSAFENKS